MSLINEALKRAKQAHARQPRVAVTEPPLQPVMHPETRWTPPPWLLAVAGCFALLLSCGFLMLWWRGTGQAAPVHPTVPRARQSSVSQIPVAQIAPAIATTNAALSSSAQASSNATQRPPGAAVAAAAATVAPATRAIETNSAPTTAVASAPSAQPVTNSVPRITSAPVVLEPPTPAPDLSEFKLQGIFYRATKSCTLINGQTLSVGDEINSAKIVAIERNSVELLIGGRTNSLKLH